MTNIFDNWIKKGEFITESKINEAAAYISFGNSMSRVMENTRYDLTKLFMKSIILSKLDKGPAGGYDLIKFFHEKYKVLFSAGTVYSYLYSMERSDLIEPDYSEGKKMFRLTAKGKETLEEFRKIKKAIINLTEKLLMNI